MSSAPLRVDCANCGARLTGPFCAACGQQARPPNPTLRHFLQDFLAELLEVDGRIFRSAWLLFARPGFLTREMFEDRRAAYVSPLKLYLFFSVLFFAASALAPTLFQLSYTPDDAEKLDPAVLAHLQAEIRAAANDALNHWLPRIMFVLMPIFAALVMLVRPRSGLNYPQHLYFAMHVHAVAFFAFTIVALANIVVVPFLSNAVTVGGLLFVLAHSAIALRNAYETSLRGMLWRAGVVGTIYWVIAGLGIAAAVLPGVLPLVLSNDQH
jgi:hypothetical protein